MKMIDELDTPIGPLRLEFDDAGLHAVTIVRGSAKDSTGDSYPRKPYPGREAFERYFNGEIDALSDLDVVMNGTTFQNSVWRALRTIPAGETLSYRQLASRVGNERASRAVGTANGRNPLCIVVPCHRVISADGSLGGFSAGLDAKRWLLNHEGAEVRA